MASIQTGIQLNDNFTGVLFGIINSVNLAVSAMDEMNQTMNQPVDTHILDGAIEQIDKATMLANGYEEMLERMNQSVPQVQQPQQPIQQSVQWQSDGIEVFNSSGIERYQQEIQSANAMLEQLSIVQNSISQQAYNTQILSPDAQRDMTALSVRIDNVRNRIQQIESNPMNIGTDVANTELEQLRAQLSQAVQQQEDLNRAVQQMDVSAANQAYLKLSQTVSNTERYIRDNTTEQGAFNQQIRDGTSQANTLVDTIKRMAGAYLSVQGASKVLGVSDELAQTTSRLDLMNDKAQTTQELLEMTYAAAQDSRGSFTDMASVVARLGNNAKDAFSSSAEVVAFATLVQKQMAIAGASTAESSNAMLQLSQALGSGVLRGDELNSIFEQAPNLIQNIADYLNQPIGSIREMASEGELTADVVKAAIFAASDDINAKFESMPVTWAQTGQMIHDTAIMAFQPVLQRLNDLANSQAFKTFTTKVINALAVLAGVLLDVFDLVASVGNFIADHWGTIGPIIGAVVAAYAAYCTVLGIYNAVQAISNGLSAISAARQLIKSGATLAEAAATTTATGAQIGFNAALLACPLTWIILLIIALIAVIVALANHFSGAGHTAQSAFGVICGAVCWAGAIIANGALAIGNVIAALASNMMTAFHNAICNIQSWFYDLLATALAVIAGVCEALNRLPFVEFDYSGVVSAANKYAAQSAEAAGNKKEYKSVADAYIEGVTTFDPNQAYKDGAAWGDGVTDKIKNTFSSGATSVPDKGAYSSELANANSSAAQTAQNTADTANNAAKISKELEITSENLKYIRDIAERDVVNRYTTASITVNQTNNNTINNDMDLDGVTEHLRSTVEEQMNAAAEGVH